jgi:hypothetical protein
LSENWQNSRLPSIAADHHVLHMYCRKKKKLLAIHPLKNPHGRWYIPIFPMFIWPIQFESHPPVPAAVKSQAVRACQSIVQKRWGLSGIWQSEFFFWK